MIWPFNCSAVNVEYKLRLRYLNVNCDVYREHYCNVESNDEYTLNIITNV